MAGPSGNVKAKLLVFANDTAVSKEVCKFVVEKATEAISKRGLFIVGLSGKPLKVFQPESVFGLELGDRTLETHILTCQKQMSE